MPAVYLSPSNEDFNLYVNGGNEEYYMNLIVDAMIPYLRASGVDFTRSNPGDSILEIIEQSNQYPYDLHLAIESNYTPDGFAEPLRGVNVLYYIYSHLGGDRAAHIFANNLKAIYPEPQLVRVIPTYPSLELQYTNAPAVLVELGYHDNPLDAAWITNNIEAIGRNLALSVTQFLGVPFVTPFPYTDKVTSSQMEGNDTDTITPEERDNVDPVTPEENEI